MRRETKTILAAALLGACAPAMAQVTFYEGEGFRGRTFTADGPIENLGGTGFNDRAASAIVERGRWEVCDDAGFRGRCVVLRHGSYDSLNGLGMAKRISSVRPVAERERYQNEAPAPLAAPTYDYRRRPDERTYEAQVTSVHAVMGPPEQRCWVEHQETSRGDPNVGGAVVGAILGGVLGHQVGNGRGNDAATVGGAIAGGAIGANVGREGGTRDVQRCETARQGNPAYWDVTYDFRGIQHRVQMSAPPAGTIAVNENGEPRG